MVNRLCIDLAGRVSEPCTRDNVKESYLTPTDHPVTVVRLTGAIPVGATCAWSFDDGDGPQISTFDCAEPVNFRARYGRTTVATVDVSSARTAASASPPRSRCAISSSPASATASRPAKAIRTARSRCRTKVFASAPISAPRPRNITGRAAPAIRADAPARRRTRCRTYGSARARCGSIPPATARSTATRPAPRWRSPCNIRTSR